MEVESPSLPIDTCLGIIGQTHLKWLFIALLRRSVGGDGWIEEMRHFGMEIVWLAQRLHHHPLKNQYNNGIKSVFHGPLRWSPFPMAMRCIFSWNRVYFPQQRLEDDREITRAGTDDKPAGMQCTGMTQNEQRTELPREGIAPINTPFVFFFFFFKFGFIRILISGRLTSSRRWRGKERTVHFRLIRWGEVRVRRARESDLRERSSRKIFYNHVGQHRNHLLSYQLETWTCPRNWNHWSWSIVSDILAINQRWILYRKEW